jgi:virginiamycin B lyase
MRFRIVTAFTVILLISQVLAAPYSPATPVAARQDKPEDKLPEGAGKKILIDACSECHAVNEVTKFAGIYGRNEWSDLVKSMIVYGAQLTTDDENVLVDYLDEHFGKE